MQVAGCATMPQMVLSADFHCAWVFLVQLTELDIGVSLHLGSLVGWLGKCVQKHAPPSHFVECLLERGKHTYT